MVKGGRRRAVRACVKRAVKARRDAGPDTKGVEDGECGREQAGGHGEGGWTEGRAWDDAGYAMRMEGCCRWLDAGGTH